MGSGVGVGEGAGEGIGVLVVSTVKVMPKTSLPVVDAASRLFHTLFYMFKICSRVRYFEPLSKIFSKISFVYLGSPWRLF